MTKPPLDLETELPGDDPAGWIAALEEIAEEAGYFEYLGPHHSAAFIEAGPRLLVTFENAETIRATLPEAEPRGFRFVREDGWSHLALISDGESWFRDGYVYRYFDRLIDDGFFEDYDDVLFTGAHAAGYAAAAFSVAAPGARVLAIRPQATLDPAVTGWDQRYRSDRRQNFTDRYGYAPEMIEAAERAYILFNPAHRFDAMHAALFTRPNATMLRADGLGWRLDTALDSIGVHDDLIRSAMTGALTPGRFARLLKPRKDNPVYQRGLVKRARDAGHTQLAARVCAYVLARREDAFLAKELDSFRAVGIPAEPRKVPASAAE